MKVNIEKLTEIASMDKKLALKLQKASKEQIISIAKEYGITLSEADFETPQGDVSDNELEAVAGGISCSCYVYGIGC